jgi:hypothetical protein
MAEIETKRERHIEIYFLLLLGFTPKEIIALGYKLNTVYKYNKEMPKILERLKAKLLKTAVEQKPEGNHE